MNGNEIEKQIEDDESAMMIGNNNEGITQQEDKTKLSEKDYGRLLEILRAPAKESTERMKKAVENYKRIMKGSEE